MSPRAVAVIRVAGSIIALPVPFHPIWQKPVARFSGLVVKEQVCDFLSCRQASGKSFSTRCKALRLFEGASLLGDEAWVGGLRTDV